MSARAPTHTILRTKLNRPRSLANILERPALLAKMDGAQGVPLTLISAPAGFGKSTLVSLWLERMEQAADAGPPSAWLSLDENDGTLQDFAAYLIAALRTLFPAACSVTLAQLQNPVSVAEDALLVSLVNEIDELRNDFAAASPVGVILVLDDYDAISNPLIDELLDELLRRPTPGLHLVVTTRRDPALRISRLRTQKQILEIRSKDLRLTQGEVAAFLKTHIHFRVTEADLDLVAEHTEGWLTGVQLLSLMLGEVAHREDLISSIDSSNRFAMDYLVDEVLSRQPPAVQESLLRTSILSRFCAPLAEAIGATTEPGGQPFVDRLRDFNLFLIGLDADDYWFRYHHLFRTLLSRQLSKHHSSGEISLLHRKAALWLSENGFIDEALDHAFASGDTDLAVAIFERVRHQFINDERWHALERWLLRFDRTTVASSPSLLLAHAWLAYSRRADVAALQSYSTRAEVILKSQGDGPEPRDDLLGEIADAQCMCAYYTGAYATSVEHGRRAMALLPRHCYLVRTQAMIHTAGALFALGDQQGAYAILAEGQRAEFDPARPYRVRALMSNCFLLWMEGELDGMLAIVDEAEALLHSGDMPETRGWVPYFRASVYYQRNQLSEAETEATKVVYDAAMGSSALATIHSMGILARTYLAQGRPALALRTLEDAATKSRLLENPGLARLLRAIGAQVAIQQVDRAAVERWLGVDGAQMAICTPAPFFNAPALVLPKALLALDTPSSRQQAYAIIDTVLDYMTATHNTRFRIEALALKALLEDREGHADAARDLLSRAILLAQPGGFLRIFADLGPRMAAMINELGRQGLAPDYVARILAACTNPPATSAGARSVELPVPLSERETQIVTLLADRLSNKEIAQALVISPLTAKRHIANIYSKLFVDNRRDAVAKAVALGILPQDARSPRRTFF